MLNTLGRFRMDQAVTFHRHEADSSTHFRRNFEPPEVVRSEGEWRHHERDQGSGEDVQDETEGATWSNEEDFLERSDWPMRSRDDF